MASDFHQYRFSRRLRAALAQGLHDRLAGGSRAGVFRNSTRASVPPTIKLNNQPSRHRQNRHPPPVRMQFETKPFSHQNSRLSGK
jgi:hypothetical protein